MICEIINDDGTMARVPDLVRFCTMHNLIMISVADLAAYPLPEDYDSADAGNPFEMRALL